MRALIALVLTWQSIAMAQSLERPFRALRVNSLGTCASVNYATMVFLNPGAPYSCTTFGWQPMTSIQGFTWVAVPDQGQGVATGVPFFRTPGSFCGIPLSFNFTVTTPATCVGACAALPVASRNSVLAVVNGTTEVCTLTVPCATPQGSAVTGSCVFAPFNPAEDTTILFRPSGTTCSKNPAGQGTGAVAITACPGQ